MSITNSKSASEFLQPRKKYWLAAGILILLFSLAILYIELSEDVWQGEGFAWDAPIMLFINQFRRPWLDALMILITQTGGGWSALVFVLFLIWLGYRRQWVITAAAAISFLGATSINAVLKLIYERPRPDVLVPLVTVNSYSFPSGHTITAMALYGFMAYVFWQNSQRMLALFTILWAGLIALSRIYLGVHYPSDVLGAIAVGGIWLSGVLMGMNYYLHRTESTPIAKA
jgi:membrane-associated phospholipid phosphatase